jgi:peroxiredoxin
VLLAPKDWGEKAMSKLNKRMNVIGLLSLCLPVILSGCLGAGEQSAMANISPEATANLPIAPVKGARAPDFMLTDLSGDEVSLSDLRGQAVLVNFWATWWPYCRSERSALQQAYEQYHDQDLVILSVDIGEGQGTVQAFAQKQGLTFPILLDENGAAAQGYRVSGIPTSFFMDHEGVIQVQHTGPLDESLIGKYLDQIL